MIKLIVCTSEATIKRRFDAANRSRAYETVFVTYEDIKNVDPTAATLLYIDVESVPKDLEKSVRSLSKREYLRVGIIDKKGVLKDIAALFHHGVVDYLGPALSKLEISTKRLKEVFDFRPVETQEATAVAPEPKSNSWKIAEDGWKSIKSGHEYTFVLLYVEIDLVSEWQEKSGRAHMNEVLSAFHKHIERIISPLGGKVWMWAENAGLVLFPFDGETCPLVETCFKLVLDRRLMSAEYYTYNTLITYRMALHIGNTVYQSRGKTGTLISDTVNFMFHLGQKYLSARNFHITDAVEPFVPPGLKKCFAPTGPFENHEILRMRLPVR